MAYTTINKSKDHFNTLLYTGDGNSSRSITGVGFAPDMVWLKGRTTTYDHRLVDKLRTGTYPKLLYPNLTTAESEDVNNIGAIGSDGFTVGSGNAVNQNSQTYVSWNWLAGGSGSANTDGDINSTVSVNQTAGFSIVSYTGTGSAGTVGHGLSSVPKMVIIKDRDDGAEPWFVYHSSIGNTGGILLNSNNATVTSSTWFNDTSPTSSVFSIGSNGGVTGSGENFIAYCFAEKTGYSKFGKYTGNGNADGTFVYTGFKPAWVMFKKTNSATSADWQIQDAKRPSYNPLPYYLEANTTNAEVDWTSSFPLDFLSNGFKFRSSGSQANNSGDTYIYMAFGQSLVGSNNIPATAR